MVHRRPPLPEPLKGCDNQFLDLRCCAGLFQKLAKNGRHFRLAEAKAHQGLARFYELAPLV